MRAATFQNTAVYLKISEEREAAVVDRPTQGWGCQMYNHVQLTVGVKILGVQIMPIHLISYHLSNSKSH